MLQLDPTLIVTRVVVLRGEATVYDGAFHEGVNVIRGENSSGKSTVLNFIFYGLGGDLGDWSDTALLCDRVYVAVDLNGKPVVLSRLISKNVGQPMEIFGGSYEESLKSTKAEWSRYPYRRSDNIESFSQAIFRLLHLPEVASEISGNLTIHQVLRLLYADQLSPIESLFRFERFDQPVLRDAVGRLLCGAYDTEIYENELSIRSLDKELSIVLGQMNSLIAVLRSEGHSLTMEWVRAEKQAIEDKRQEVQARIASGEAELFYAAEKDQISLAAQQRAYEMVKQLQAALREETKKHDALALSIADSDRFIRDLNARLAALNDVNLVASEIGTISFSMCPVCYAPIENSVPTHGHEDHCHLCKAPFDSQRGKDRVATIINDLGRQLKQADRLQRDRIKELETHKVTIARLEAGWREAARDLAAVSSLPSTEARAELRKLERELGYLDREGEDLGRKERLIALMDDLSRRRDVLNRDIARLKSRNEALKAEQRQALDRSYTEIADVVKILLKSDLPRQDSFMDPKSVAFDFEGNKITVDGHSYFSASSRVILKSSFYLGFLIAAAKDPRFRHPRFCMLDTIEDKGMEEARSHNFQNVILKSSQSLPAKHQIIFATAMIAPELDNEKYTVGKASSLSGPTLAIGQNV